MECGYAQVLCTTKTTMKYTHSSWNDIMASEPKCVEGSDFCRYTGVDGVLFVPLLVATISHCYFVLVFSLLSLQLHSSVVFVKGQGCTSQRRVLLWRTQNILAFSQVHLSSSKRRITLSYGLGFTDTTAVPTVFCFFIYNHQWYILFTRWIIFIITLSTFVRTAKMLLVFLTPERCVIIEHDFFRTKNVTPICAIRLLL